MLGDMIEQPAAADRPAPKRQLTLFDSTCIIVGIIIGAGIYETTPGIAACAPSAGWLIGFWVLGGVISLMGALCYAELATAYPREGGDYVYLTRALGRSPGFLFAWAQLWVIRPGSIGAMAFIFGRYANRLWPFAERFDEPVGAFSDVPEARIAYAVLSIVVLSGINYLGVREGKWTQNLLTVVKVAGLAMIIVVGLLFGRGHAPPPAAAKGLAGADFRLAMILILYTYGGWNEMAYVGAEVRNPNRNILRALVVGTVAVTVIYVLVNLAFVHALGLEGTRRSAAVAADVFRLGAGKWGGRAISLLVCISALGAMNGMIFTGARIYYAMGTEHRLFAWLGRWSGRTGTPVASLLIQAAITLVLTVAFGWLTRETKGGFQAMVEFTTPIFWFFFLLVGLSLFVLRYREPETPRPYRVPGYPVVPILFCVSSLFMLYSSLSYAVSESSYEAIWAVGLMAIGVALSLLRR